MTTAIQNITPVEAELDLVLSAEAKVKARADSWVSAWQQQMRIIFLVTLQSLSLALKIAWRIGALAHWRASRTRVIGNAQWIRLTLPEYEVIEELPNTVKVHFWLDYESPTFSNSTKKKLVLSRDSGDWTILEEINLQVRS